MQAVSYTTGVPAMCGAMMFLTGKWNLKGVHNVEVQVIIAIPTELSHSLCRIGPCIEVSLDPIELVNLRKPYKIPESADFLLKGIQ